MLCLVSLLCLGDEQVISLFSIHVDTLVNLGGFLSLLRSCEGSFKLPRLFPSDELPLNEDFFFKLESVKKNRKIGMRPYYGEKSE